MGAQQRRAPGGAIHDQTPPSHPRLYRVVRLDRIRLPPREAIARLEPAEEAGPHRRPHRRSDRAFETSYLTCPHGGVRRLDRLGDRAGVVPTFRSPSLSRGRPVFDASTGSATQVGGPHPSVPEPVEGSSRVRCLAKLGDPGGGPSPLGHSSLRRPTSRSPSLSRGRPVFDASTGSANAPWVDAFRS